MLPQAGTEVICKDGAQILPHVGRVLRTFHTAQTGHPYTDHPIRDAARAVLVFRAFLQEQPVFGVVRLFEVRQILRKGLAAQIFIIHPLFIVLAVEELFIQKSRALLRQHLVEGRISRVAGLARHDG